MKLIQLSNRIRAAVFGAALMSVMQAGTAHAFQKTFLGAGVQAPAGTTNIYETFTARSLRASSSSAQIPGVAGAVLRRLTL